jgi:hypothetical protein
MLEKATVIIHRIDRDDPSAGYKGAIVIGRKEFVYSAGPGGVTIKDTEGNTVPDTHADYPVLESLALTTAHMAYRDGKTAGAYIIDTPEIPINGNQELLDVFAGHDQTTGSTGTSGWRLSAEECQKILRDLREHLDSGE